MTTYKQVRELTVPFAAAEPNMPGDWRAEFVGNLDDTAQTPHFIAIQFGSKNFGQQSARALVKKIMDAINS